MAGAKALVNRYANIRNRARKAPRVPNVNRPTTGVKAVPAHYDDSRIGPMTVKSKVTKKMRAIGDSGTFSLRPGKGGKRKIGYGTEALRQIRQAQKIVQKAIPRIAFARLVREIAGDFKSDLRFQASALVALQEAAETFLVCLFGGAQLNACFARRITVTDRDIKHCIVILKHFNHPAFINWDMPAGKDIGWGEKPLRN